MFGRKKQVSQVEPGRYRVVTIGIGLKAQTTHSGEVQEALNEGESQGWRLVSATTAGSNVMYATMLFWDTQAG